MHSLIKLFNQKILNTLIKQTACLFFIALFFVLSSACGNRKPPLPPTERIAQRVAIDGSQIGNQIRIVWQMPARNAPDGSLLNIERADIYRLAEPLDAPLSLTEEDFADRSTVIASIPITETDFGLKEKVYIDTLQFSDQAARLRYAVRFVNSAGQKAAFSNFLLIAPSSRIALNPDSLSAEVLQEEINLEWKAPAANVDGSMPVNVLGYNIYRETLDTVSPGAQRLNESLIKSTEFIDRFFKFETKYRYFVRAVSLGKNGEEVESLSSEALEIVPKDTFPPEPPGSLTIASAPGTISIFFAVNLEKDIAGYRVYRSTDPDLPEADWTLLTPELLTENTFQDKRVEAGRKYFYYLTAVDRFGNVSAASEIVSETAF